MKTFLIITLSLGLTGAAGAADPELGRLPDGDYYIKGEVDFALKEPAARAYSAVT